MHGQLQYRGGDVCNDGCICVVFHGHTGPQDHKYARISSLGEGQSILELKYNIDFIRNSILYFTYTHLIVTIRVFAKLSV